MTTPEQWRSALDAWGIPADILDQAPTSPWVHPPALFTVPAEIPDTPSHSRARESLPVGGTVLDIGCGGGIAAFACVPQAARVIGVDHQQEMLDNFVAEAVRRQVSAAVVLGDWPDVADQTPTADVVTCHHVVYNVADIVPFIQNLNSHAERRVVIEMPQQHPLAGMSGLWSHFWNLERPANPTHLDLVDLLTAEGFDVKFEEWDSTPRSIDLDLESEFMTTRLCLPESARADVRKFLEDNPPSSVRKLATLWWDV